MSRPFAFLKKDYLCESSYRLPLLLNVFNILSGVLVFFFIDKLFGQRLVAHLESFGVNYFSYVLVGMAFFSYIGTSLGSFSGQLQREQSQGTLEAILATPTPPATILFSMGLWNLMVATVDLLIYAVLGKWLFGVDFSGVNGLSLSVVTLLTITSFTALGIFSACFILVFKRGNPVGWILNSFEGLLGGVYFPVTVLPAGLQVLAQLLPITYAIRAIQLSIYKGATVVELKTEIIALCAFSVVLLPLSLLAFRRALKSARQHGSLAQY